MVGEPGIEKVRRRSVANALKLRFDRLDWPFTGVMGDSTMALKADEFRKRQRNTGVSPRVPTKPYAIGSMADG